MHPRVLSALLLALAFATPLAAGELLIPLAAGVAPDGTTYATRVWVTNTGGAIRRWTPTFIAAGADGTRAAAGTPIAVAPGATVLATNLAPAGQSGMLLVSGAPQLLITTRLEATGPGGALRGGVAGPLVTGHQLAAGHATLHLHGLSQKAGGLTTDIYLINASRAPAQCTVDAFRDDGSRIASTVGYALPPLSLRTWAGALAVLGATDVAEARVAVTCDQAFYAWARVYKPGGAELNVMTPAHGLGRAVTTP